MALEMMMIHYKGWRDYYCNSWTRLLVLVKRTCN